MKKIFLACSLTLAGTLLLSLGGCVVEPGYYGDSYYGSAYGGGEIAPALPMVVELYDGPYYSYSGFYYFYDNNQWYYSRVRGGHWAPLPPVYWPRDTRWRGRVFHNDHWRGPGGPRPGQPAFNGGPRPGQPAFNGGPRPNTPNFHPNSGPQPTIPGFRPNPGVAPGVRPGGVTPPAHPVARPAAPVPVRPAPGMRPNVPQPAAAAGGLRLPPQQKNNPFKGGQPQQTKQPPKPGELPFGK